MENFDDKKLVWNIAEVHVTSLLTDATRA